MFQKNPIEAQLDVEILELLKKMEQETDKHTEKYVAMVDQFNKLMELRNKSRISNEVIATIAANLGGIAIILFHERAHVIATKSLNLVKKLF